MNGPTIAVLSVVVIAAVLATIRVRKKGGCSGCSKGCGSCSVNSKE
ncbi:FeoB-associated Cys-rich membrane protein [Peptostreptococcus russellii]|nr:FeoB-associated Cys-rich membrane protein [Peptostreptococcus russellii]